MGTFLILSMMSLNPAKAAFDFLGIRRYVKSKGADAQAWVVATLNCISQALLISEFPEQGAGHAGEISGQNIQSRGLRAT